MKSFVRLAAVLLLVSLVVASASTLAFTADAVAASHHAKAARKACATRSVACVLFRAGRITVVQTTSALVRVVKHEFGVGRDTVPAAPSPAR